MIRLPYPALIVLTLMLAPSCRNPERSKLNAAEFRQLMETVAAGWNEGNARKAAECFTVDAIYAELADKQAYEGRATLYDFFGGDKGRDKPMHMVWHHLAFDPKEQLGFGEYTFAMNNQSHGVVVVKLAGAKIRYWREYEYQSKLEWSEFTKNGGF